MKFGNILLIVMVLFFSTCFSKQTRFLTSGIHETSRAQSLLHQNIGILNRIANPFGLQEYAKRQSYEQCLKLYDFFKENPTGNTRQELIAVMQRLALETGLSRFTVEQLLSTAYPVYSEELFKTNIVSGTTVISLAWNSDETRLAIGTNSGQIIVTDNQLNILSTYSDGDTNAINGIAWNQNLNQFAVRQGTQLKIWGASTTTPEQNFTFPDAITEVSWRPNGTHVIAASAGFPNDMRIYETTGWTVTFTDAFLPLASSAWSPDGTKVATGSLIAGYIGVYDFNGTGLDLGSLRIHFFVPFTYSYSLDWDPINDRIVVGNDSGDLGIVLDPLIPGGTKVFAGVHAGQLRSVRWSPDGTFFASKGFDGTLKIWDVSDSDPNNWDLVNPAYSFVLGGASASTMDWQINNIVVSNELDPARISIYGDKN